MIKIKTPKTLNNKANNLVYKELKNAIKDGSKLSVISAYFTMYAYYELKDELDKIDDMRLLFTQPSFLDEEDKEVREYFINNENDIFGNDYEIRLRNEMNQSPVSKLCSNWIKDKVEVKSFKKPNTAQPRMINVENSTDENISIQGTVDFTTDGLGLTPSDREDLNTCLYGDLSLANQLVFNSIWDNPDTVVDIKEDLLKQLSRMYEENSPEFIYFVTMYNIFYNYLDELDEEKIVKTRTGFKDTKIWNKLYKFQKDAVYGVINKIENYNGCILADSVGLGKTFTALAVIKYYELRNDRVLVLVPKKLRDNWTIYTINDKRNIFADDRFNYDVLNHTDLSRESGMSGNIDLKTINWSNYDLIVIDESHNFRNNPARKNHKTRYEKLMEDIIKEGVETKVLMLSATPVNNRMTDIKNQIGFITEDNDDALEHIGIKSISSTLKEAQRTFNQWSTLESDERTIETFTELADPNYFKLLDTLTLARSRKHIEKYYNIKDIGDFPNRLDPINIHSQIDNQDKFPQIEEINNKISHLSLAVYNPIKYLKIGKKEAYGELYDTQVSENVRFRQESRDENVTHLIRINLLKRMESSIHSFTLTLEKLQYKIEHTLNKIEENENYDMDIDIELIDPDNEEYDDQMFGEKRKVLFQDIDLLKWVPELERDKKILEEIITESRKIKPQRDAKLDDLKKQISLKLENPINKDNKKILIFTAFADTAKYLYENLHQWIQEEYDLYTGLVTGSGTNKTTLKTLQSTTDFNEILLNFSPKSKERNKIEEGDRGEISILIGTDCISEGQNLQDCDYLINYDIHWNPVRIIQRFGRIDRIGSTNKDIQLVNFWPNVDLDEYIDLNQRVSNRMILADINATADENILKQEEINEIEYRKKQLTRLQNEVVDLEEISGGISITDLTYNDFKVDLMEYLKNNKKELSQSPHGIYAVTKNNLPEEVKPGVIFLLKQIKGETRQKDNSLTPYYLIYVTEDNTVQLNYNQNKKIMDYYKKLCLGDNKIDTKLIRKFETETDNGINMNKYSKLLTTAIDEIQGKKRETGTQSLFEKGGTITIPKDHQGLEDFELISFLIIKNEDN